MKSNDAKLLISLAELRQMLSYDSKSGIFIWTQHRHLTGKRAGCIHRTGYRQISIGKKAFLEHRLAWLFTYGAWPSGALDHKNRNKTDNRIGNLREATHSQNMINANVQNALGAKGVMPSGSKYWARIKVGNKRLCFGPYLTQEEAYSAYRQAAIEHYGEFGLE